MRQYRGTPIDKPIDSGEFVYGCLFVPQGSIRTFVITGHLESGWPVIKQREVHPKTVGQSTGLKDKNFWQDDILESEDKLRRYAIKWDEVFGRWYLSGLGEAWCLQGDEIDWRKYTKIGNIHEELK